jgi:hypothetical protein
MLAFAEYEVFVAGLVADLLKKRSISKLGSGATNRLKGISGVCHQIDVSFIDNHRSPSALVIIECKRLTERIALADVKVLKATLDDLVGHGGHPGVGRGLLVSTQEPQSGAKDYAAYYGIDVQKTTQGASYRFSYDGLSLVASPALFVSSPSVSFGGAALGSCAQCGAVFASSGLQTICAECKSAQNAG